MIPIKFPESNVVFAEHQDEYEDLPAHRDESGSITVCWKLTVRERIKLLLTGKLWQQVHTFGDLLQPQLLTTDKPYIEL